MQRDGSVYIDNGYICYRPIQGRNADLGMSAAVCCSQSIVTVHFAILLERVNVMQLRAYT